MAVCNSVTLATKAPKIPGRVATWLPSPLSGPGVRAVFPGSNFRFMGSGIHG